MRKARVLFLLLLVIAVLSAGLFALRHRAVDRQDGFERQAEAPQAGPGPAPAQQASNAVIRPTFDIVRAEPDGSVIMAGRSEPGWTVSVQSGGQPIGRTVADSNGEWIVQPLDLLPKGEYSLELSAQSPTGDRTLFSPQRLALSLSDPKVDQPLVALTEEGKSTRVLQMPPAAGAAPKKGGGFEAAAVAVPAPNTSGSGSANADTLPPSPIGFSSVDYEDAGEKSMLHMNGQATPGSRVLLYVDDSYAGSAMADATGTWSFSGNRTLSSGGHTLRADIVEKDGGKPKEAKVVARAEVRFDRADGETRIAAEKAPKVAALDDRAPVGKPAKDAAPARGTGVIIVRRGDTLWQIARRHYGDGSKYTQIFRSNRNQIRNPNKIYPSQQFEMPQ